MQPLKEALGGLAVVSSPQHIVKQVHLATDGSALKRALNISQSCFKVTEVEFDRASFPLSFDLDRKPDLLRRKSSDGRRLRELALRAF